MIRSTGLASVICNVVQVSPKFDSTLLRVSPTSTPSQAPNSPRVQSYHLHTHPTYSAGCSHRAHYSRIACSRGTEHEEGLSISVSLNSMLCSNESPKERYPVLNHLAALTMLRPLTVLLPVSRKKREVNLRIMCPLLELLRYVYAQLLRLVLVWVSKMELARHLNFSLGMVHETYGSVFELCIYWNRVCQWTICLSLF